jgi:hypothetical protein
MLMLPATKTLPTLRSCPIDLVARMPARRAVRKTAFERARREQTLR